MDTMLDPLQTERLNNNTSMHRAFSLGSIEGNSLDRCLMSTLLHTQATAFMAWQQNQVLSGWHTCASINF
jgi:hypothetical protein